MPVAHEPDIEPRYGARNGRETVFSYQIDYGRL